jgi:hypothetical protein
MERDKIVIISTILGQNILIFICIYKLKYLETLTAPSHQVYAGSTSLIQNPKLQN